MSLLDAFKGKKSVLEGPVTVCAACKGTYVPMAEIPDEVFAQGVLGQCCGIEPVEGKVFAPMDGKIIQVHDTLHALGLSGPDGVEILIHVGIDTVDMNGDGFTAKIKEGSKVKKGDLLLTMDLERIKAAGHPTIVVMVLTNGDDYSRKEWVASGKVEAGSELLKVSR